MFGNPQINLENGWVIPPGSHRADEGVTIRDQTTSLLPLQITSVEVHKKLWGVWCFVDNYKYKFETKKDGSVWLQILNKSKNFDTWWICLSYPGDSKPNVPENNEQVFWGLGGWRHDDNKIGLKPRFGVRFYVKEICSHYFKLFSDPDDERNAEVEICFRNPRGLFQEVSVGS
jgi:hypothetical protein